MTSPVLGLALVEEKDPEMCIRNEVAAARQDGLSIIVAVERRVHRRAPESDSNKLLRLLAKPQLTSRQFGELRGLMGSMEAAQIADLILRADEDFRPLHLPRDYSCDECAHPIVPHKPSDADRLLDMIWSRHDQQES